jgi:hypothetical protein
MARQTHLYAHLSGTDITCNCHSRVSIKHILPLQNRVMQLVKPISTLTSLGSISHSCVSVKGVSEYLTIPEQIERARQTHLYIHQQVYSHNKVMTQPHCYKAYSIWSRLVSDPFFPNQVGEPGHNGSPSFVSKPSSETLRSYLFISDLISIHIVHERELRLGQ